MHDFGPAFDEALSSWRLWGESQPEVEREFNEGLSNRSILVRSGSARFVIRINSPYSAWWNIDREIELRAHKDAARAGIATPVAHADADAGYLITQFLPGKTLAKKTFVEMDWLTGLAQLLTTIHQLPRHGQPLDYVAHCRHFLRYARYSDRQLSALENRIDALSERLAGLRFTDTAMCHHDLGPYNILPWQGRLLAMDFEYARVGLPALDIVLTMEEHRLTAAQREALLLSYRASGLQGSEADLRRLRPLHTLFELLWHGVLARIKETDVDPLQTRRRFARLRYLWGLV